MKSPKMGFRFDCSFDLPLACSHILTRTYTHAHSFSVSISLPGTRTHFNTHIHTTRVHTHSLSLSLIHTRFRHYDQLSTSICFMFPELFMLSRLQIFWTILIPLETVGRQFHVRNILALSSKSSLLSICYPGEQAKRIWFPKWVKVNW